MSPLLGDHLLAPQMGCRALVCGGDSSSAVSFGVGREKMLGGGEPARVGKLTKAGEWRQHSRDSGGEDTIPRMGEKAVQGDGVCRTMWRMANGIDVRPGCRVCLASASH